MSHPKISTCTIQISLELTEPEALADFLRRGSASASGSMDCIGKFIFNRTGRKIFAGLICFINALFIAFTILPKSTVLGQATLNARVIEVDPSHSGIDFVHTDGSSGNRQ